MVTTPRSELLEELEKALTDEAYDGGMGALTETEFTFLVRGLAETAVTVIIEAQISADAPEIDKAIGREELAWTLYEAATAKASSESAHVVPWVEVFPAFRSNFLALAEGALQAGCVFAAAQSYEEATQVGDA